MDDNENNSAPEPELSTPAHDSAPAENEQPTTDQSEGSDSDLDTQGTDPEFQEVDYEGKKYSVPPEVKAALLRQADYTRKTQELATQREQSTAEIAAERARIESDRANIQAVARLTALDDRLNQYHQVNWQELSQQDPVRAQQEFFAFQQLKDARQGFVSQIQQHEHQRALQEQQATAKALQQANEVLGREIKGWSPEYAKSLREVARELGASDKDLDGIRAPWIVRALNAQKQLAELTKKATKAPPPPAATAVRTITGGNAKGVTDPDKLSIDEWMARENKRAAKLGRRY